MAIPDDLSNPHEKTDCHHHRPSADGLDLLQALDAIAGSGAAVYFGPERKSARLSALEGERERLVARGPVAERPAAKADFTGGEHDVWLIGNPPAQVRKQRLDGGYGRTLDEESLLDPRIFQNRRKLVLRAALPSEYLLRWAVLRDAFQLPTDYEGQVLGKGGSFNMAVTQPYIPQDENDQPLIEDIERFMKAYGFLKVDPDIIALPEIKDVMWYRRRDGVLISDAFPRNFRKDSDTQALMPIDLVVALVPPPGTSKLLHDPETLWTPTKGPIISFADTVGKAV